MKRDSVILFIGGLHRSGTSLLANTLGMHEDISLFSDTGVPEDEGQFLQSVYKPAADFGGPGKFGFDSDSYLNEYSNLVSEENANRILSQWKSFWDTSKSILLEKSPPNLVRMRFLQELFPSSYFIVVLRHPIAVSYATRKWSDLRPDSLIKHWLVCHNRFLLDKPFINNILVLRYEEFITNTVSILNDIFKFLNLEGQINAQNIKNDYNQKYFNVFENLDHRGLIYKIYKKYIQIRFEDKIKKFGYSLNSSEYILTPPNYMLH